MKRLFILGFTIIAFGANSFAGGNEVIKKLTNDKTLNGVARYLDADTQQKQELQYIFSESSRRYEKATAKGLSEAQASEKAINFNLANVRVVLSPEQYKKFVRVLNISVNNEAQKSLLAEK